RADALAWLDAERSNLVAVATFAAEVGPWSVAWSLSYVLRGYFHLRMFTVEWLSLAGAGLTAAVRDGHLAAQAAARLGLGDLQWRISRYPQAIEHYSAATALAAQAGWVQGEAAVHGHLGIVYQQSGRLDRAVDQFRQALAIADRTGWQAGQAANLENLG